MQYVERELDLQIQKYQLELGFIKPNGSPSIISLWYIDIEWKNLLCNTKIGKNSFNILESQSNTVVLKLHQIKPPYKGSRGEGIVKIIPSKGPEILHILIKKYLRRRKNQHYQNF